MKHFKIEGGDNKTRGLVEDFMVDKEDNFINALRRCHLIILAEDRMPTKEEMQQLVKEANKWQMNQHIEQKK